MTKEAKMVIEAMKEALDVFEKMELPFEEREFNLEYESVMAIISGFEQVTRERDAAVEDMKIIRSCRQCKTWQEYFKDNGDVSPCEDCDMYSNWQWRGVEVTNDAKKGSDAKS